MASQIETAWAAGLFEGEGCFHLRRDRENYRSYLEMSISMTDLDVLEKFHAITNAGTVTPRPARLAQPHHKPQYTWRVSGKAALHLAGQLEPHVCSRRIQKLSDIRIKIADSQPKPRNCECCDKPFTPTRFNRERFCSTPCRDRAKYLKRKYDTTSLALAIDLGYTVSIRPELRTHCKHGHELSGANILYYTRPTTNRRERRCRQCAHGRYLRSVDRLA